MTTIPNMNEPTPNFDFENASSLAIKVELNARNTMSVGILPPDFVCLVCQRNRRDAGTDTDIRRLKILWSDTEKSFGAHLGCCFSVRLIDDKTGQRFGKLTVLGMDFEASSRKKGTYWKCLRDCGKRISVGTNRLRDTLSCGCKRQDGFLKSGERIGCLLVLDVVGRDSGHPLYRALCDCGLICTRKLFRSNKALKTCSKECGQEGSWAQRQPIRLDIGTTFGQLTVVGHVQGSVGKIMHLLRCKCGNTLYETGSDVAYYVRRRTKISCGCHGARMSKSRVISTKYLEVRRNNSLSRKSQKSTVPSRSFAEIRAARKRTLNGGAN